MTPAAALVALALLAASPRPVRAQDFASYELFGVVEAENAVTYPDTIKSQCFDGLPFTSATLETCVRQRAPQHPHRPHLTSHPTLHSCGTIRDKDMGDGWMAFDTNAVNAIDRGVICLACCTNSDTSVGEDKDEWWRIQCRLSTARDRDVNANLFGYEMRFARMLTPQDNEVITCPVPRSGCEYVNDQGDRITCTPDPDDGDGGGCYEVDGERGAKITHCTCTVPGGYGVDQSRVVCMKTRSPYFLEGYELTIEVVEMSDSTDGRYWRSVRGCSVVTKEIDRLTYGLEDGDQVHQLIHMISALDDDHYDWLSMEGGLIWLLSIVGLSILFLWLFCRWLRDEHCPVCGGRMILNCGDPMCWWCAFYGSDLPDRFLAERLRTRDRQLRGITAQSRIYGDFCGWASRCRKRKPKHQFDPDMPRSAAVDGRFVEAPINAKTQKYKVKPKTMRYQITIERGGVEWGEQPPPRSPWLYQRLWRALWWLLCIPFRVKKRDKEAEKEARRRKKREGELAKKITCCQRLWACVTCGCCRRRKTGGDDASSVSDDSSSASAVSSSSDDTPALPAPEGGGGGGSSVGDVSELESAA